MEEFDQLLQKLDENKIEYNIIDREMQLHKGKTNDKIRRRVVFNIGRGRELEEFKVTEGSKNIKYLVESDFQKYKFIKGYEAIWSKEKGVIECEVENIYGPDRLLKKIKELIDSHSDGDDNPFMDKDSIPYDAEVEEAIENGKEEFIREVELYKVKNIVVKIGRSTDEFAALKGYKIRRIPINTVKERTITIKFENCSISRHDEALNIISKLGLAIEFLLTENHLLNIRMVTEKKYNTVRSLRKDIEYDFHYKKVIIPKYEYDVEPLSLYLHARSRDSLPLYSYLAFYQVLEYYFPKYSEIETKNVLRRTLKDPKFNLDDDGHLDDLLKQVNVNKSNGHSDELTQLRAVISGCVSEIEIKKSLDDYSFEEYFTNNSWKLISNKKISLNPQNTELINQVANRIYDIRCNIVHKKSSFISKSNGILPHTISYYDILNDLELIQFLSYKSLVANSRLLNI